MATWKIALTVSLWAALTVAAAGQEKTHGPVRVTIQEEKAEFAGPNFPIDPKRRVEFQMQGGMNLRITSEKKMLHAEYLWTSLKIDDQVQHQGPWKVEAQNISLPKTAGGKPRDGFYSVYTAGRIRVTQSVEVVPGLKPGQKERLLDTVLVRCTIENKDFLPHRVGMRRGMNVYLIDNSGALFAAPNQPNKLLNGVELKGKTMPDYLQVLQHANLQNPGYVAHMTLALGSQFERPDSVVLTSAEAGASDSWHMDVVPANMDSALYLLWEPKELKPGGKRELAFAYGGGVATSTENEGKVNIDLAGSFEPGKRFTINAFVADPAPGQSLTLELPANMELIHGRETQPVPPPDRDGNCLVQWQARVVQTGTSSLRIQSSTGASYARNISISRQ